MLSTTLTGTDDVEHIVLRQLRGPQQLAGIEIKGEHGVAGLGRRLREVVSGTGVDDSLLGVDGWRRPDARARGSPVLHTCRSFGRWLGLFHCVGLPNLLACGCVERYQRAA